MDNSKLLKYISECRRKNVSDIDIANSLISAGWPKDLVLEAISPKSPVAAPRDVFISIKDVYKDYDIYKNLKVSALKGITLDIYRKEFLAIIGPSGSGKTTLLNLLGLIDTPTSGEILIDGENIHKLRERRKAKFRLDSISFIFQSYNLINNYNVLDNIALPLWLQGYGKKIGRERAKDIIEFLGLSERMNFLPTRLSGGEQQRIAVGRALAKDSVLIIADEPTANLDSKNGGAIINLLKNIKSKFGKTIILVTHELEYAQMADRMVYIKDGKITEIKELKNEERDYLSIV